MNRQPRLRSRLTAMALWAAFSIPACAGPPLVCHRLEIGSFRSLPWGDDPAAWDQPSGNYNVVDLSKETLALLTPEMPVIVRMETIRRAVIYGQRSPEAAKELALKISARAHEAEAQGRSDPLAMFDYGYLIEATKEAGWAYHGSNMAMKLDGYPWVARALDASHDNPEMEFAAALIVMGRNDLKPHGDHAQKALAAGSADALLARNLSTFFVGTRGDTMTTLLTKEAARDE